MDKPSYLNFDNKTYAWKPDVDYRQHPDLYRVGKGEQGVLICHPYKNEIGIYWRFKDAAIAKVSSEKIFELFVGYLSQGDFVGADIARKYLQMGFTRARRYANYKGGKKYDKENNYKQFERGTGEEEKAAAAAIFYDKWQLAETNKLYSELKNEWKLRYG
jgi:hypothetical protein